MVTLSQTLSHSHDWAIDRIHYHCDKNNYENAYSIQAEFSEWINPDILEHDIVSLEYIGE